MARGQKRKRTNTHADATQACDIPEDMDPGDLRFTRYYDPNQDAETRRQIKRKSRALQREFNGRYALQESALLALMSP
jgi:hypothetical protein